MATKTQFPHLTDTESVRQEADSQYGGLSDAGAFLAAHKATYSPDVSAAALRHRNPDETAKVQNDLSIAQDLVDKTHGEGTYTVIDAAVRGDALSAVVEDKSGRTSHLVVGYNDRWKSISPKGPAAEERVNAEAEAATRRLGAEARAEIKRQVDEATAEITARVNEMLAGVLDKLSDAREHRLEAVREDESQPSRRSRRGARGGSPSTTGGNDTSETGAGATTGSESDTGDGGGDEDEPAEWPRHHDDLDAIAADEGIEWEGARTVDEKIARLEAEGAEPPSPPEES